MSVAEVLPSIRGLARAEKLRLLQYLAQDLASQEEAAVELKPLPEGFPPPEDHCPYTREELEAMRRQPGVYTLAEIWRSLGRQ